MAVFDFITIAPGLLAVVLVALLLVVGPAEADKDANRYSFGSNPNVNRHMYWADAAGVLDDLDKFSALYIKYEGCAWSPNMAYFDDDGENRDGDEHWYEGRTATYGANAAFSLYGTLKARPLSFGGCTKSTYINSFFTNGGADVLVDALGLNNVESGSAYCQEYNGNNNRRHLGSGDGNGQSYTMGCGEDGRFTTAIFNDDYCQGMYFANLTVDDGAFDDYNSALGKVNCKKIWSGSNRETDNGYSSVADEILMQSEVCHLEVNPYDCPDPWGKKSQDAKYFALAQQGRSVTFQLRYRKPMLTVATVCFLLGLAFVGFAYVLNNRQRMMVNGGGSTLRGFVMCAVEDAGESSRKIRKSIGNRIRGSRKEKKQKKGRRKKLLRRGKDGPPMDEIEKPSVEMT